jgi:hypothetical protein
MIFFSEPATRGGGQPSKARTMANLSRLSLLLAASSLVFAVSQPWKQGDPSAWTAHDLDAILGSSPWAAPADASFALAEDNEPPPPGPLPGAAQAGMAGPRGVTDGRWDGGVGRPDRNGPPTLTVTVRWDSALPVRLALEREKQGSAPSQRDYIISVLGLVPAHHAIPADTRRSSTSSSDDDPTAAAHQAETLAGVMRYSRLYPKGQPGIAPEDAKLDVATGTLRLFFPRTIPITAAEKEVLFQMRFGSLSVAHRFRLKDMQYKGQLEL